MKRLSMLLLTVMMLILVDKNAPLPTAQSQSAADIPYIYYYSYELDTFVIERADGTDSRLFGDGLAPEDTNTIGGPGWSPSGEWFAWTAAYYYHSFPFSGHLPYVLNANGERLVHFDDYLDAVMEWSPVDDVLLVAGIKGEIDSEWETSEEQVEVSMILAFEMIDVPTDTVIASFETPHDVSFNLGRANGPSISYVAQPSIVWSADSQQAKLSYLPERADPESGQPFDVNTVILGRDGNTQAFVEVVDYSEPVIELVGTGALHTGKKARYLDDDQTSIILEDIFTDERFGINIDAGRIARVHLNPTSNAALLFVNLECTALPCQTDVWFWEAASHTTTRIIQEIPTREAEWSPDGQYALFAPRESSPTIFTMSTRSIKRLDDVAPHRHQYPLEYTWVDDDGIRFIIGEWPEYIGVEYDLSTLTIMHTFPDFVGHETDSFMGAQWSPDGTKLALVDDGVFILNEDLGEMVAIRPDGRGWMSVDGGEAYWHSGGEWLFVADDALVAGGGEPRHIGITNIDGTIRRDLSACQDLDCYGWLPLNVDIEQLPDPAPASMFPKPRRILQGNEWIFYLDFSPDGSQIVRGSSIVDVETGEVVGELDSSPYINETVEWILDDEGNYIPQIVDVTREVWGDDEDSFIIAHSPDGALTVVTNRDDGEKIYDTATQTLVFAIERPSDYPRVLFSPDGRLMTRYGEHTNVLLYDTSTWELITPRHTYAKSSAFSPDGQTLALATSWDIQLWDVEELIGR